MASCWLLGEFYEDCDDDSYSEQLRSILWLTYRRLFPAFVPYEIRSDAGWGCMLRSAQMLLATALLRHTLGRDWRAPEAFEECVRQAEFAGVAKLFMDLPGSAHLFSIHNMVQMGMNYDKLPGEWYGPSTASYVLRDLARVGSAELGIDLAVMVVQGGEVYRDEVEKVATEDPSKEDARPEADRDGAGGSNDELARVREEDRDTAQRGELHVNGDLGDSADCDGNDHDNGNGDGNGTPLYWSKPWLRSVLVLLPLRLGPGSFIDSEYREALADTLEWPQSVGFVGGRPKHAIYFFGHAEAPPRGNDEHAAEQSDSQQTPSAAFNNALASGVNLGLRLGIGFEMVAGPTFIGLDPHTVQQAPYSELRGRHAPVEDEADILDDDEILLDFIRSMRREKPATLSASLLDPSLALGFLVQSRVELLDLLHRIRTCGAAPSDEPPPASGGPMNGSSHITEESGATERQPRMPRPTLISSADFAPASFDFSEGGAGLGGDHDAWNEDGVRVMEDVEDDWCAIR